MITANIIKRTYHISINNDIGSCFTIEHKGEQYIITAKHVIDSEEFKNGDEITVQIFHEEQWKKIKCIVFIHNNSEIDIAILKTKQLQFIQLPIKIGNERIIYGSDVYFLGFPYGMFSPDDDGMLNQKFPIPFVKKGILSAIITKYDITSFYLDAHNNKGFSGGPVFIVNPNENNEVSIIGVNVSYIKHDNVIDIEEQDEDGQLYNEKFEYYENSGIMESQSIVHAIDIIEKNCG